LDNCVVFNDGPMAVTMCSIASSLCSVSPKSFALLAIIMQPFASRLSGTIYLRCCVH